MPDQCWPAEGITQGLCSSLPKPPLKHQGTGPLSQHPKLRSVPLHWQESLVPTKPCPWLAVTMALRCLSFPTWKVGAAAPTPLHSALQAAGWFY